MTEPALRRGDSVYLVGLSRSLQATSRKSTVTNPCAALNIGSADCPRYRATNMEVIELDTDFGSTFSGVLTDDRGRVQAIWGSFSTQLKYGGSTSEDHQFVRGLPVYAISEVLDKIISGGKGPRLLINGIKRPMPLVRILEVELYPTLLSKARSFGLSDDWVQALVKKDPVRRQVLRVKGCLAGSKAEHLLEQGDMILAIKKEPITCFRDIERACQELDVSEESAGELNMTIFRQGQEIELVVGTDVRDGNGTARMVNWCGCIVQDPHPAVRKHLVFLRKKGMVCMWQVTKDIHLVIPADALASYKNAEWCHGSPAHRYGLYALQWIVEVNGKLTPDLDSFVEVAKGLEHEEFVRIRTVHLNGKPRVLTLKQDLHYWATWELNFDPETAMWRRRIIKSLDASSLHSGSISFGRFESEPLSWERRSSFSHNRYLEEVEKYSTPGSVTQKKAYFEAHFKKKALLRQGSECENGMEDQTSENDNPDQADSVEESEQNNEGKLFTCYYENMDGFDDDEGYEVMDCAKESNEISPDDFHMDTSVVSAVPTNCGDLQQVECGELHQTHFGSGSVKLVSDESELDEKQKLNDVAEGIVRLADSRDQSLKSQMTGKDRLVSLRKSQKPKVKVVSALVQTKITSGTSEDMSRVEKEGMRKIRKEKQFPQKDPTSSKAKPRQENISTTLQTGQEAISDKSAAKTNVNPSTPVFSLRSDDRAEKRKEFYMKLEEKLHAKEAALNQIQAKTQEEAEAHIKQFRRSLNFKAKPMPSFYHGALSPQILETRKAVDSRAKSTNLRSKSTSSRSSQSSSFLAQGNHQSLSANKPVRRTVQSHSPSCSIGLPSEAGNSLLSPSTTKQTGRRTNAAGKKEEEKLKNSDRRNQHGSESISVKKGEKIERKQVGKSGSEMIKTMKGISIGESSGMSLSSVDVAS
ncbi:hypothetical protein IFM89_014258 [Coptis chinensis]|uniref:TPX2 C-terminal domain-containing protein n=1 Tax=Coptis chinensis TaxID=261450 RepID=A0A835H606_9MAGN|nr:hypothetical protein IFM89_014258 [Coptis chinensis]